MGHAPFELDPLFVLCLFDDVILQCLCTKGTRDAMLVVIEDRRYLAITAYMFLRRIPRRDLASASWLSTRRRTWLRPVSWVLRLGPE